MLDWAHAWGRIRARTKLKGVSLHTLRHSLPRRLIRWVAPSRPSRRCWDILAARNEPLHPYVDATLLTAADRVSGAIARAMSGEAPATVTKIGDRRHA